MISDVDKDQIISMWSVTVENKLTEKYFIILLANGSHHCSCLSLINRGIICRHYFQIMLRSPIAKFHLRLIPSRWYYKDKDPSKEPFLVASKFEDKTIPIIPQHNIPFLTAINQTTPQDFITQHERLTDIQLYGKIAGLTRKATMKAIKKKDMRIVYLLEDYLEEDEEQNENVDNIGLESDKENNSFILNNPNKQTRPKGRPKSAKRIKAHHEKEFSSITSKQYKCGHCGDMGHNKRNCNRL
jgi:hypothetical protein